MTEENQTAQHGIFIGPNGLRAGWAALVFAVILMSTLLLLEISVQITNAALHVQKVNPHDYLPGFAYLHEGLQFVAWLVAAWVMARIEKRPILSYNYTGEHKAARFFFGLIWGFIAASALILGLWKLGWLGFDGPPVMNFASLRYAVEWGVFFLLVAFVEESWLRAYLQATLTRGMGFWWAALALSIGFGCLHIGNDGESLLGVASAAGAGLLFCLSLWYTGSLWWAIGFHATWDWAESYFYGTADSGLITHGRLMTAHPAGKNLLLSGGTVGPEGSVLVLLVLAIAAAAMKMWWGPRVSSRFADCAWRPKKVTPVDAATDAASLSD